MGKRLYVGNLDYGTTSDTLCELFAEHGEVTSVGVIEDAYSGRSRGFAFVEMGSDQEATAAIAALNARQVDGRDIKVAEAHPRRRQRGVPLSSLGRHTQSKHS